MPVKNCPEHPERDTMVPCLGCGRYFCRICDPLGGAGQYCSRCYRASLSELEEKHTRRPAGVHGFFKIRKREGVHGETAVDAERAPSDVSVVTQEKKQAAAIAPGSLSRVVSYSAGAVKEHFPLVDSEVEKYDGEPRLRDCWYKLVAVVLSGAATWTLVAALTNHRWPLVSVIVAFLVAAGTVWSLGTRFGVMVGLFAMALALLSLATGEVIVQVLFRYGVIETLNLPAVSLSQVESRAGMYSRFFYNVLVLRFLPSAVVAFLVGWWPISRRIGWRGFRISGRG